MERVIVGWRPISSLSIAMRYNTGDNHYEKKMDFVFDTLFSEKLKYEASR